MSSKRKAEIVSKTEKGKEIAKESEDEALGDLDLDRSEFSDIFSFFFLVFFNHFRR